MPDESGGRGLMNRPPRRRERAQPASEADPTATPPAAVPEAAAAPEAVSNPPAPGLITVRIAKLGEKVLEVEGPEGMTAAEALDRAQISSHGFLVRVGGEDVSLDVKLHNGDMISLRGRVEGGD